MKSIFYIAKINLEAAEVPGRITLVQERTTLLRITTAKDRTTHGSHPLA